MCWLLPLHLHFFYTLVVFEVFPRSCILHVVVKYEKKKYFLFWYMSAIYSRSYPKFSRAISLKRMAVSFDTQPLFVAHRFLQLVVYIHIIFVL